MTATCPLTLDLNQLAERYAQLQTNSGGPTGYHDEDGSLYFISAGSEYRLHNPACAQIQTPLSASAKQAFQTLLSNLQYWVEHNVPADQQAPDLARIQAALNEVNSNTIYPALQIDTLIDHVRGSQPDDHARVLVQLIWSSGLGSWLPIEVSMGFTWAQEEAEVPDSVMKLLGAPNNSHLLSYLGDMIEVLGDALEVIQLVEYAAKAWNFAVGEFSKIADDGGRAYFPVVVSEAFTRIVLSVRYTGASGGPASAATVTPDLKKLGQCWLARITFSDYTKNNYWYFSSDITVPVTDPSGRKTTGTYQPSLPDLVYLDGGTMVSFKVVVDGSPIFAAIMMLLDGDGRLRMATGAVQFHDDSVAIAPVEWGDGTDAAAVIAPVIAAFAAGVPQTGSDDTAGRERTLPSVLQTYMTQVAASLRAAPAGGAFDALPQIPGLTVGTTFATVARGRQRPAVAVAASGYALCLSCDPSGTDALWADTLSSGSTSVITSTQASHSYQNGQDPAVVAIGDGSSLFEVHGGNGNNKVYWNVFGLSNGTATPPDQGKEYAKGENPAIAIWNDTLYEIHRDGNSDSDTLYWMLGTTSNGPAGVAYPLADGDNVAATVLPGTDVFVAAYVRDGAIYTKCGTASSTGLSIPSDAEQRLMDGDGPTVVGVGNGVVLLLSHGSGSWSNQLQYSIGLWDPTTTSIQWFVAGMAWGTGQFPSASARTDHAVVVATEGADSASTIYAYVANVTMPDGFLG